MDAIDTAGLALALVPLLAQAGPLPGTGLSTGTGTDGVAPPTARPDDPLATVGLALLAYGLVQILSRVIDRLPFGRGSPGDPAAAFTADDRKRLERMLEIVVADHERVERIQETLRDVHEQTRGLSEMRLRVDARDGEPLWRCRAAAVAEQAATNQRLIGQTLDEVRSAQGKLDDVLRKLRALWLKMGHRKGDRR